MDANPVEKKAKTVVKNSTYAQIRVRKETRKRVVQDLARANKKDYGRTIHADEYIALAISKVTQDDIKALQDGSLSHADRMDRDYRKYVADHGLISKDAYLGIILKAAQGNLQPKSGDDVAAESN